MKTFRVGGLHPAEEKRSQDEFIEDFPLPDKVVISTLQHLGTPSSPIVKKGDKVLVGDVIAKGQTVLSADIHASVSGEIEDVSPIIDIFGHKRLAITIKRDGDYWREDIKKGASSKEEGHFEAHDIIEAIKKAGIVGLGGATFPTHLKLSPRLGQIPEILLINGIECEPYLTSDHRLMLEKAPSLLLGIRLLMKALKVERTIIGIEANKKNAYELLKNEAKRFHGIFVELLETRYPQGGERQLIQALLKKEVPAGKFPIDIGVVVQNVSTVYAVYEAVMKNKPLIERVVTVSGPLVPQPKNLKVRVGTTVKSLLDYCGVEFTQSMKVVSGGPMMGQCLYQLDSAVNKGVGGILCFPEPELPVSSACICCGQCSSVCSMGLEPFLLEKLILKERYDDALKEKVLNCLECGSCSYICPAHRPLLEWIRAGKIIVRSLQSEKKR